MIDTISPRQILKLINFWPPFLASGIKVKSFNEAGTQIDVEMKLRSYNTNYVGVHFGGNLYSMCDPFYMFILLHHLKDDHIVWDQEAKIKFVRPGQGTVRASFVVELNEIEEIKQKANKSYSVRPVFKTSILNDSGEEVAIVEKTLYVRRKDAKRNQGS